MKEVLLIVGFVIASLVVQFGLMYLMFDLCGITVLLLRDGIAFVAKREDGDED